MLSAINDHDNRLPVPHLLSDAQTIRHKAQEQQDQHIVPSGKGIVLRQRKEQNPDTRTEPFERSSPSRIRLSWSDSVRYSREYDIF
jgi:hypothetical protein